MTKPTQPPTRGQLIAQLRATIAALENHGAQAERMAPLLAARGWPTTTLGDGGSRGTSELTSTEAAASHRDRWADADEKLARFYLQTHILVSAGQQLIADLTAHAIADDDHEPGMVRTTKAGAGWCIGCGRWVTGAPDDRLRGGACNACAMAWTRFKAQHPNADRVLFMRNRPPHNQAPEPVHVDPTQPATSALRLDTARASTATHDPVEATRWHHGHTTNLTDPAA